MFKSETTQKLAEEITKNRKKTERLKKEMEKRWDKLESCKK
jgi:hypothetical protein